MTKQILVIILLLIPLFSFGQDFKLFKSKKENGVYIANSFKNYECEIIGEQVMAISSHPHLVVFDVYEKDTIELYLIAKNELRFYENKVKVDSMRLVVKPNELEKVSLIEGMDTFDLKIRGTNEIWFLGNENKSRNSSSWMKINKEEDVYKVVSYSPKYKSESAKPNEYETFYYINENILFPEIINKKILYYKFIKKEIREINIPIPYQTVTKPILKHTTQVYPIKTISNKQAKKLLPKIKEKLQSLNYYQGGINKKIDNNFVISMTSFQKDNNLPIGQFDLKTLEELGIY